MQAKFTQMVYEKKQIQSRYDNIRKHRAGQHCFKLLALISSFQHMNIRKMVLDRLNTINKKLTKLKKFLEKTKTAQRAQSNPVHALQLVFSLDIIKNWYISYIIYYKIFGKLTIGLI